MAKSSLTQSSSNPKLRDQKHVTEVILLYRLFLELEFDKFEFNPKSSLANSSSNLLYLSHNLN